MKHCIIILLLFLFASCKLSEKNIIGVYKLPEHYAKTELAIYSNNKFTFLRNNSIQALLKNENYISTCGIWAKEKGNKIILQSISDSAKHLLFKIQEDVAKESNISCFTFFDTFGDTVDISAYYRNKECLGKVHGRQPSIKISISKGDSLNFYFTGYKQWDFLKDNKRNLDYRITLFPEFNSEYFNQTEFLIKHKALIDKKNKIKYKKNKA
ncbi:hypothetical protein GALL_205130 [mine drainage metagenome]|uniref:Lipoprotein n=1 Tax=mine drainage metagenome TaxID=410659 RepID=A0A1J5S005_9ZZZZ